MKMIASILFGALVSSVIVAMKAAPSDSFMTPTVYASVIATAFMLVLLDIMRPSK